MADPKAAKEWSTEQIEFQRWLAVPKKARAPKTQRDFAAGITVHETTLCDWKRIPGFMAEVKRFAVELIDDDVPEIIAKMVSQAKGGSFIHQQAVLDMAEVYQQKVRQEHTGEAGGPIVLKVVYDTRTDRPSEDAAPETD